MVHRFDPNRTLLQIKLFLANPNKGTIGKIKYFYECKQVLKKQNVNEITLSLPLKVTINHQIVNNPTVNIIRERHLIRVIDVNNGDAVEWYIVSKIVKDATDFNKISVTAYSLFYETKYKKVRNYTAVSYNCQQVLTDCLLGTGWTTGYINPDFNLQYRQFDNFSGTRMDFFFHICTVFNAVYKFDTVNRIVNLYKEVETEVDNHLRFTHKNYIQTIQQTIDIDTVCTRLHMFGSNDISIQGVNPTGQNYVDDFSYWLYPFQRDVNRNVITHSDFMSDALCHAILDFNILLTQKFTDFNSLLTQQKNAQTALTPLQNDLAQLQTDFTIILNNIEVAKDTGSSLTTLYSQRDAKQVDINNKNTQIQAQQAVINGIATSISSIGTTLSLANNFSPTLLAELNDYTFEEEFSDSSIVYDSDLYTAGMAHFKTINTPPVNVSMSAIDFRQILKEQYNWDKLVLGSVVRIWHERLNILIKTIINEISIDYDMGTINLNITNNKLIESDKNKFMNIFYNLQKTVGDSSTKVMNLQTVAKNFNLRNDRISAKPANPIVRTDGTAISKTVNDNGSVSLKVVWDFATTADDAHNIDGFIIHTYSSSLSDTYTFGSNKEQLVPVEQSLRSYVFPGLPANLYYTFGIQAYRTVDTDVSSTGYLLSDVISTGNSYQPLPNVNLNGKVNNIMHTTSNAAPINPSVKDVWNDTVANKTNIYTVTGWQVTNSANSDTVAGYNAALTNVPNTVAVRDATGAIAANINGDATSLSGKTIDKFILQTEKGIANGVPTLDASGNVPLSQLTNVSTKIPSYAMGTYTGDGTVSKLISLGWQPTTIRVYTTKNNDFSSYINSLTGGFLMKNNTSTFYLEGTGTNLDVASDLYGKLSATGFITGSSVDTYLNKLNVKYIYEAIKIP